MNAELWAIAGVLLMLLLSGNIYFVKRLVDRVEKTGDGHEGIKASVTLLANSVTAIGNQLSEIKLEIKDLRRIEIEVAVLRAQFNPAKGRST